MEEQPRITDLIPKSYWGFFFLGVAGVAVIAGLEGLYAWMGHLAHFTSDGRIAAFDLDGEGSLSSWYSSMILAGAGLTALIVYSVRRHKEDDYYGRYRVWGWASAAWFVMSLDESGSLHEGFKELMAQLTGRRLMGDGSLWWVIPYFCFLGYVGIRLLLEMRVCRTSTTFLVFSAMCFAGSIPVQLGWLMPESGAMGVMVEEGLEMSGGLLLLLAMGMHARYAILEASGELPVRVAKQKRQRKSKSETHESAVPHSAAHAPSSSTSPASLTTPAYKSSTTPLPAASKPSASPLSRFTNALRGGAAPTNQAGQASAGSRATPSQPHQGSYQASQQRLDDEEDPQGDHRRLSKAERKALKKRQQQERDWDNE